MTGSYRQAWQDNRGGVAGSLMLHGLAALIWLWWHMGHPAPPPQPLKAMLVDLVAPPVITPTTVSAPAGGAALPLHAPHSAPRIEGTRLQAVKPPPDALEARIQSLASLTAPDTALPAADNDGSASGNGAGGGYALADFVRAQILRHWWPDLESASARGTPVALRLSMTRAGVISNIRILDQQRFNTDKLFHAMALSARNAALNASPIALPPGRYDEVMDIAITLDPKAVLH